MNYLDSDAFGLLMESVCERCMANTKACHFYGKTENSKCVLVGDTMHKMFALCIQLDGFVRQLEEAADLAVRED